MNEMKKRINAAFAVFICASIVLAAGCGKTKSLQTDTQAMPVVSEEQQENPEAQSVGDPARMQETGQETDGETDGNMRTYSDTMNRKTAAEYEAEDRARRAMLEERVRAAGGISEEEAIEIAEKALETDLGEKGKELKLVIDETYGWSSDLCVADWSEIKEENKGAIAYSVGFNNAEEGTELEDLLNYNCVVNAADGSILEACSIQGWDIVVYYEH